MTPAVRQLLSHSLGDNECPDPVQFVLPNSHDQPAGARKCFVSVDVAAPVPIDLGRPIPTVHVVAAAAMDRAAMPEATVDKDRHSGGPEDDVGLASQTQEGRPV